MLKSTCIFWFYIFIFLNHFQYGQCFIQCYLCADCGDPFSELNPYVSVVTNQNYGASCIKTVLTVPSGKLVSRGTTFNCVPASTSDIKVYCCGGDLCNGSNELKKSSIILLFPFLIHFMFF